MKRKPHLDKYKLLTLKVGESREFFFYMRKYANYRNAAFNAGKRIGGKYSTEVIHSKPKKILITRVA